MTASFEFERKAPYAPISALREFFQRIRDTGIPARVDRRFLQRLNVASNNEWALLSALKFLEVVDERGVPTHAYRQLQTTNHFEDTLRHLVETAYRPLLEVGGTSMSVEDLQNYFRVSSSPSQAKSAARFFREVCKLAGVVSARAQIDRPQESPGRRARDSQPPGGQEESTPAPGGRDLLAVKAELLAKLPPARAEWSASEYREICQIFLEMLQGLGAGE